MSTIDDKARELGALMDAADLRQQLAAVEAALRLATNSTPGRGTGVWVPLDKWTELHAQIDRYGADQWRSGNAGREPQEWDEWRQEQAADRRAAFNGGEI